MTAATADPATKQPAVPVVLTLHASTTTDQSSHGPTDQASAWRPIPNGGLVDHAILPGPAAE